MTRLLSIEIALTSLFDFPFRCSPINAFISVSGSVIDIEEISQVYFVPNSQSVSLNTHETSMTRTFKIKICHKSGRKDSSRTTEM
jgi:hypothetical protein